MARRARYRSFASPLALVVLAGGSFAAPTQANAHRAPGTAAQDEVVEAIRQRVERARDAALLEALDRD
jgi:hypothetical protein